MWDGRFEVNAIKYDLKCLIMKDGTWLKLKQKYHQTRVDKLISYEILKTLPVIKVKKELYIPFLIQNKNISNYPFKIKFNPQIPITKKNF